MSRVIEDLDQYTITKTILPRAKAFFGSNPNIQVTVISKALIYTCIHITKPHKYKYAHVLTFTHTHKHRKKVVQMYLLFKV